ncbi:hypothetical protein [Lacihabitans sp. LS3-19]|uniref:pentapeptide repeat-containing protein n=1 Tax=Lacihabitans sp. LS3-19 TaxID=2487335 RepID=UPI0020CFC658|nr:hypothetical protein [Lacihabitans sp. LS3-19]
MFRLALLILVVLGSVNFCRSEQTIKAESIIKSIAKKKPIFLENVTIEGDLDFTKLNANPESKIQSRVKISSPVYFQNCRFKGKIIGFVERDEMLVLSYFETNLSFFNCTFYSDILLNGAIVGTSLALAESKLHGELHLENALIGHDANFSENIFGRKVFFQNTIFRKNAYFNKSIFNEIGYFQSCKWKGEAVFREVEFRENVDFSLQKSFSPMSFNFSHFKKAVFFEGSKFGDDLEIDNVTAERILLSGCQFWQKLNFEALNSKEIHFTDAIFYTFVPDLSKILNPETVLEQTGVRYLNTVK